MILGVTGVKALLTGLLFLSLNASNASDKIQVFVLAGQSNMSGGGKLQGPLDFDESVSGKVRIWDGAAYWKAKKAYPKRWVSLKEVQELKKGIGRDWIGPEFGFARAMAPKVPAEKIYLIKVSCGGTGIDWWLPRDKEDDDRYQWHRRLIENIDAALEAISGEYEVAGMLWMQGETDTMRKTPPQSYQKSLQELVAVMRQKFNRPDMPFVIGRITIQLLKSKKYQWPFTEVVQAAQDAVAENDPHAYVIHSDDLSLRSDFTHFDVPGQLALGERFGQAMLKAMGKDK
jgi:hypothetical protein